MHYIHKYHSTLGEILLASDGEALIGLWFDGQKYFGSTLTESYVQKELPIFIETMRWLDMYFEGRQPDFTPSLSTQQFSSFRREVWEIMLNIPYGQTMTYGAIAAELAQQRGIEKMSAHAVGGAVSHNPISIIIPCHRVVGSDGSLTGYAGGIDKKIQLLTLEKADMTKLYTPKKGTAL